MAPRAPRRRRTRRLAARPRGRPRLAPAAHREKIRQTHRPPRLAPRRRLDALLQAATRTKRLATEVQRLRERTREALKPRRYILCSPLFASVPQWQFIGGAHGTRRTSQNAPNDRSAT